MTAKGLEPEKQRQSNGKGNGKDKVKSNVSGQCNGNGRKLWRPTRLDFYFKTVGVEGP
jgi:hypothetical protein